MQIIGDKCTGLKTSIKVTWDTIGNVGHVLRKWEVNITILDRTFKKGFPKKATFQYKYEGHKETNPVDIRSILSFSTRNIH